MRKTTLAILASIILAAGHQMFAATLQPVDDAFEICPLLTGEKIPQVSLADLDGNDFNLIEAVTSKPTILIFFRGGWCPYCNAHLSELSEYEKEFLDLGYQIIAISADKPEALREGFSEKPFNYTLLSDNELVAASAFGLAYKVSDELYSQLLEYGINLEKASGKSHHLLPVPAAYVIGTDSVIKFLYVNPDYKIRVNPKVLLAAAKAALEK